MRVIEVSARKGGVGTTVVATAIAVALSNRGENVLLVDATGSGDSCAVLGIAIPEADGFTEVTTTLGVIIHKEKGMLAEVASHDVVVVDAGITKTPGRTYWGMTPHRVAVVRNSYLSLRAEVADRNTACDTLVVVTEKDSALTYTDAVNVVPHKTRHMEVPHDPNLARAVDAGLFTMRANLYQEWAERFTPVSH